MARSERYLTLVHQKLRSLSSHDSINYARKQFNNIPIPREHTPTFAGAGGGSIYKVNSDGSVDTKTDYTVFSTTKSAALKFKKDMVRAMKATPALGVKVLKFKVEFRKWGE